MSKKEMIKIMQRLWAESDGFRKLARDTSNSFTGDERIDMEQKSRLLEIAGNLLEDFICDSQGGVDVLVADALMASYDND